LIAALNELAAKILHRVFPGATYDEVTKAFEKPYGNYHLETAFHSQLKRRTQLVRESLQEFSAATDHLANRAHVGGRPCILRRLKERDIRRRVPSGVGGKEAISEALELEADIIAAGTPSRGQKTTVRTFLKSQFTKWTDRTTDNSGAGAVGAPTTFKWTVGIG
jgi:hypothetical protein